jgi:hypothetical protein
VSRNHGFTRHRRSKTCVATFSAFEADLLRSLGRQLIELLRNEEATPHTTDELEALLDFSGPTTEPDDPVLARLFPTAYPEDRRPPPTSAASPRPACATARPTPRRW